MKKQLLSSDNDDSILSLDIYQDNNITKRRRKKFSVRNIFKKINKIEKKQEDTNIKLDIILSIMKSKFLGEYDYNISNNYFSIIRDSNNNKDDIKNKEENDYNIKDDFVSIKTIKKEPYIPNTNLNNNIINVNNSLDNTENLNNNKINVNNSLDNTGNLKQIINDFLYQDKKENINNEDIKINGENNLDKDLNTNSSKQDIKNENNKDIIEKGKISEEIANINNNVNSILNNLNIINKSNLDLNKYKFEPKNIESNDNNINKENGISNIYINNEEKKDKNKTEKINVFENEDIENMNINEEINLKKIKENYNINYEDKKDSESKLDNSQSDNISVSSISSNSSSKKSNKGSSRKIRGFNFRNNINIKKYMGNKNDGSTSMDNNKK